MTPRQATDLDACGKLGLLKKLGSHILLELKALREGACKMGESTAFSQHLVMQIMPELCGLLKVVPKVHPEIQAMLIDIQQYMPMWVVGGTSVVPKDLDFKSRAMGKWEDELDEPVDVDTMHCTRLALGKVSLPPKACFVLVKVLNVELDGGF